MIAVQAWNLVIRRKADFQKTEEYQHGVKKILDGEVYFDDGVGNPEAHVED